MNSKTILLIDDDIDISKLTKIVLEEAGYKVTTVFRGKEGIRKAKENKIDLIILDIMMPGMDGYQFCKLIKNRHSYQNIPVVICTAKRTRDDLEKAIKVKVDDYLLKPFSREYLLEKVEKWIKGIK